MGQWHIKSRMQPSLHPPAQRLANLPELNRFDHTQETHPVLPLGSAPTSFPGQLSLIPHGTLHPSGMAGLAQPLVAPTFSLFHRQEVTLHSGIAFLANSWACVFSWGSICGYVSPGALGSPQQVLYSRGHWVGGWPAFLLENEELLG